MLITNSYSCNLHIPEERAARKATEHEFGYSVAVCRGRMSGYPKLCAALPSLLGATIVSWLCHDGLRQDWLTVDARAVQCGWLSVDARAVRPYCSSSIYICGSLPQSMSCGHQYAGIVDDRAHVACRLHVPGYCAVRPCCGVGWGYHCVVALPRWPTARLVDGGRTSRAGLRVGLM